MPLLHILLSKIKQHHVSELGVTCWVCCVCVGGCLKLSIVLKHCASGCIRSGLISAVIIRAGVHNVGSSKTAGVQNGGGCKMAVVAKCR